MPEARDDAYGARVVAVVVAFNRRELLLEALEALQGQTAHVSRIVVIDNASSDGSADAARTAAPDADILSLARNTGGAGGFAVGAQRAVKVHGADFVWLMDDDTIPGPDALERLLAAVGHDREVVIAGSRVLWTDGSDHPMNTPRQKPFVSRRERNAATKVEALAIRSSSFVSMLVRADAIRDRGLPIADYFIWNDDFEFSTRMLRGRRGLFVPASVVVHKTKKIGSTDADPGDRFYYEVRNKIWLLRFSRGLNPAEKALYGASTLRRWLRTFQKSRRPSVLRRGLRTGLRDGFRTRPRPNAESLADVMSSPEPTLLPESTSLRTEPFSLLLPVYAGDRAAYFGKAFTSAVTEQTLRPAEVVLVQDGPIGDDLRAEIDRVVAGSPVPVERVILDQNVGLAQALTEGLARCSHDIVARMDADDISLPHRFAVQIAALLDESLDLVGAGLLEFADEDGSVIARRTPPVGAFTIAGSARFRDPFNHPTVVYRKSAVARAGGYRDLGLMEDYWLFARMIQTGAVVDNVADPLVMYRVGDGAYQRRGGWSQLHAELLLQKELRGSGFTSRGQYLRNIAVRGGYRLVPVALRKRAYRRLFASDSIR